MRLLVSTVIALIVSFGFFIMVKMWGLSQPFIDYQHPFLDSTTKPVIFHYLKDGWTMDEVNRLQGKNLYLNIGVTQDEVPVITRKFFYQIRTKKFAEVKNDVYTAEQIADFLKEKKIIFNVLENPIAGPEIFIEFIVKAGLQESRNFMVTSPFDVPLKFIKEKQPTYYFGTSQPEILRIKAMENLWLVEAATFRADIVVHPPLYYKHEFFTPILLTELKRRFKRHIIGPVTLSELEKIKDLEPAKTAFAIIVND